MHGNMMRGNEDDEIVEQKLWRAVIASTVREPIRGSLTGNARLNNFFFGTIKVYRTMCFSADRSGKPSRAAAKNSRTNRFRCTCTSIKELILSATGNRHAQTAPEFRNMS